MISLVNKDLKMEAIKNNMNNNVYIDIIDIKDLIKDSKSRTKIFTVFVNISVFLLILSIFYFIYFFRDEIANGHKDDSNVQTIYNSPILPYNFFKKI